MASMYGCTVCEHQGNRLDCVCVYLPGVHPERTHAKVLAAGRAAEHTCEPVFRLKRVSSLAHSSSLVASIPMDYMHAVLEGVTKWLTNAWFSSANTINLTTLVAHYPKLKSCCISNVPLKSSAIHHNQLNRI